MTRAGTTHTPPFTVGFTPVTQDELPMLGSWLRMPHNRQWWGDPETELSYIRDMVEGRDTTRPYIFHVDERPLGYIQCWFVADTLFEPWTTDYPGLLDVPLDTVGVDLSIGDPAQLSKGIGSRVLSIFVERLVAGGHRTIIIDPDPDNARAVRAYEKAGFKSIPELLGRSGDSLIMKHTKSESEHRP